MIKSLIRYSATLCLFVISAVTFAAEDTVTPPEGYQPTLSNVQYSNRSGKAAKDAPVVLDKADVLLIQTALPWGSNANTTVLDKLGYSYAIADIGAISTINLFNYRIILIVNDQNQAFYDSYATKYSEFEAYVESGGTLLFFATDNGWAGGNNTTDLPGHVQVGDEFDNFNTIVKNEHVIVTGELTGPPNFTDYPKLKNNDLDGTFTSHNYFVENTLPPKSTVVMRSKTSQLPTLVSYPLGNGMVIASGITWEYTYDRFTGVGTQYGFGRALPDIINYAMTIGDGKKFDAALHVYPDDNRNPSSHPTLWKAPGDILDIVAQVENNTNAAFENVTVSMEILESALELGPGQLVFFRDNAWDIQDNELAANKYELVSDSGALTIKVPNLTIEPGVQELVFRVMLNKASALRVVDAKVTILNSDNDVINSKYLLDKGQVFVNYKTGAKHIITNRKALIEEYGQTKRDRAEFEDFWASLYKIAAEQHAIVNFVDKFDRDYDDDNDDDHIIGWRSDRETLIRDEYDADVNSGNEEADINKASIAVAEYLKDTITLAGDTGRKGVYVAILGGDVIIPHYRVYDNTSSLFAGDVSARSTVLKFGASSNEAGPFRIDGINGYLHTDGFYRELDNNGDWRKGAVNDVYVGRIAGPDISAIHALLKSSNRTQSESSNAVKVENAERNGELDAYQTSLLAENFDLVNDIDSVTTDKSPTFANGNRVNTDDVRWSDFLKLFSGKSTNTDDFDVIRFMSHGNVKGLYPSSGQRFSYMTGENINQDSDDISESFDGYNPIFVLDACLVGQVDGNNTDSFLNSLLATNVGGVVAASVVTWTGSNADISMYNDQFSNKLLDGTTAGKALSQTYRSFQVNSVPGVGEMDDLHRLSVNLFGLPWAKTSAPIQAIPKPATLRSSKRPATSVAAKDCGVCNIIQEIAVDASQYTVENNDFDFVHVDGFELIKENFDVPVLASKNIEVLLPAGATIVSVTYVQTVPPTALGALNIPGFSFGNPLHSNNVDGASYVLLEGLAVNYPTQVVTYEAADLTDSTVLSINVIPFDFNPATQQTTLFTQGKVLIEYQSAILGTAKNLRTDLVEYTPGEDLVASVMVQNTSDGISQFTATFTLEDTFGTQLDSVTVSKDIASGVSDDISDSLSFPNIEGGNYVVNVEVKDASANVLAELTTDVTYAKVVIRSVTFPKNFNKEKVNTLTFVLENLDNQNLTGSISMDIYNDDDELVSKLLKKNFDLANNALTSVDYVWIPPESIRSGRYYARAVLTINEVEIALKPARKAKAIAAPLQLKVFTFKSQTFTIIGGGGNLVTDTSGATPPSSTITITTETTTSKSGGAFGFMCLLLSIAFVRRKYFLK